MAAYEVLLLNTAIPQIQAAQSGDTYVVPRDIAFSTVANLANGTNLLPSLTFSSDTNTGIYREGADALGFTAGGGTNQMVLTSTGLGVGTNNPAYKLHVVNDTAATNTAVDVLALTQSSTGTADSGLGAGILFNSERPSGGVIIKRGAIYGVAGTDPDDDGALTFYTLSDTGPSGFTEKMRLDSSGNLGLGVTPSASTSNYRTLQIGGGASVRYGIFGQRVLGSAENFMGWNAYGGNNTNTYATGFYYTNSGDGATLYSQTGFHSWHVAPSGTAGNAISFTQAMTLDASGNLLVGDTTQYGTANRAAVFSANKFGLSIIDTTAQATGVGGALNLGGNYRTNGDAQAFVRVAAAKENSTDNNYAYAMTFSTTPNGGTFTEAARITSGGGFLVGDTTTATNGGPGFKVLTPASGHWDPLVVTSENSAGYSCWDIYSTSAGAYRFYVTTTGVINATNTTISAISDQRLKENIRDLDVGLNAVLALKPRKFDWKAGKGKDKKDDRGWIAQEFEQVFPDMIDEWKDPAPEGEEPYKAVRADLIPVLVKAIQEQQAMINELKAEVVALKGA